MINTVIDTNVLVSAALSPKGTCARIMALISNTDEIQVFYSTKILDEYIKVLAYDKLKIAEYIQKDITNTLTAFGILIEPPTSINPMPDESDRIFYDTAKQARAFLVTGNIKHYPPEAFILSPADFIHELGF